MLLASAAWVGLAIAGNAQAQTSDVSGPDFAIDAPQTASVDLAALLGQAPTSNGPEFAVDAAQPGTAATTVINTPNVVVEGPGTGYTPAPGVPGSIIDDAVDVTGVGQFYRADGYVCTGTLINPRTVLFAAHCVNDRNPEEYGVATGGVPAAFSFKADALGGFIDWVNSGFNSVPDSYVYNVNQILYNPASVARPEGLGFLEGDIAIASLDTPATNVPTWALLFSPLPAPNTIDSVDGTGYHVRVNGYGASGYGDTGAIYGVDFRRRAAENMIGILGSFNDRDNFLFGPPGANDPNLPQNLYQLDFDDPARANPFDFNLFKDDARNPEGSTAGGDSGGPLILDQTYAEELVIGVLSGGSRFFGPQPFSSYGTESFYQPLYLFWDWIVANSPYRYTQSKAGDGMWSDPDHWVTALDPNFRIIDANGDLVNGVPSTAGAGTAGDGSKFGQICNGAYCYDLATGDYVDYDGNVLLAGDPAPAGGTPDALPDPTLANGLPGATGYVPDNIDPQVIIDPDTGATTIVNARYFDVTLAAAGTTTLDTGVTIDKLSLMGGETALDITGNGSLTSLTDINQLAGSMNVDGTLSSNGDYFLMTGMLSGSGTLNVPYFTNLMGLVAPGSVGTVGTLDFNGNVILTSASGYAVDLGTDGVSDRIAVHSTGVDANGDPTDGLASIGGTVMFSPTDGTLLRDGYSYTILTAEAGYDGTFTTSDLSAILRPELSYGPNAVTMEIVAGSYVSVVDRSSSTQLAFARLLDQNRSQYDRYADLYGPLDIQNAATIQATLETFAPRTQAVKQGMGTTAVETANRFIRNRINQIGSGDMGGSLAMYGQPVALASAAATNPMTATSLAGGTGAETVERSGVLPDDVSGFLAGGYIDGDSAGMPATTMAGRDTFDGYFIAGGLEKAIDANGAIGLAFSYTSLDGMTPVATHSAKGDLYQGTLYTVYNYGGGIRFDAQMSAGAFDTRTTRQVSAGGTNYSITGRDRAFVFTSEVGLGKVFGTGSFDITPRVAFRASHIGFTPVAEQGGGPALQYALGNYDSVQGRAGINLTGRGMFKPFLNATYVHDFRDKPAAFGANFVGGIGPNAIFALPGHDQDYGEVSGGVGYAGNGFDISLAADTTVARDDLSYQSYRGTVTFHF
ncbi:autotransporter domain-containing protein [Stakelama marina]|uniref:autotransporter domain-containing protein n=1 Tax=Stakelama marina TaxID=2826939 RepID=UPI0024C27CE5|nr:autotransporter domain-containing protein [Stakelama marina]